MSLRRTLLPSVLWLSAGLVGGCNLIFGVTAGTREGSGGGSGGASASTATASTSASTSTSTTASTSASTGASTTASSSSGATGGGGAAACSPDRIPACDVDGGACSAELVDTEIDADDLALSGDLLFFTTGDGDAIHRVRYDGTGGSDILAGYATTRCSLQGDRIYWTDYYGGSVVKGCNLDGSGLTTVAVMDSSDQIGNGYIAADTTNTFVYWTTYAPPGLWRTTPDGSKQSATQVLTHNPSAGIDAPTGVAVDATYLYWGDSDGVRRMLLTDVGTANPPFEAYAIDASAPVNGVILDTDRVYWITATGDVRSKAKTDPPALAPLVHLSASQDQPLGLAVDEAFVYWVTLSGAVQKAGLTAATVLPVAFGPPLQFDSAGGLAVDCGAVYWAVPAMTGGMGRVFKAAKGP